MGEPRDTAAVDTWFAERAHPLEDAMQRVREVTLGVSPDIGECVKWSTPTFTYRGNIFSFNPAKQFVSLLWHQGAKIPGDVPGLEGDGATARVMRFADVDDVEARRGDLEQAIRAWMAWKDG
jgi:hypothetical protein